MAKIGLIDVDGHNFPNLCLMKISAHHKRQGDSVEWWNGFEHYDTVYKSRVFDDTYSTEDHTVINADVIIRGGTGYGLDNKLADEIEHIYPDYNLYPQFNGAYGFLTRGCPRNCPFCIVSEKEGRISRKVADLSEFWQEQKTIKLLDPNLLACKDHENLLQQLVSSGARVDFTQGLDARMLCRDNIGLLQKVKTKMVHFAWDGEKDSDIIIGNLQKYKRITGVDRRKAAVYVLTNYNTDFEFDLYRVNTLREIGYDPYVMVYDKQTAPRKVRLLQRWVNNRRIWATIDRFEDYDSKIG